MTFFLEWLVANVREGTSLHPAAAESSCIDQINMHRESAMQLQDYFTYLSASILFNYSRCQNAVK